MKTSVFITSFNVRIKRIQFPSESDILSVISSLIKPIKYLPYDDKIKLVITTIEQTENEKYPTPMRYRNLIINLINTYTQLEISVEDFDILSFNNLLDPIIATFKSEYIICDSLMKMIVDDMLIEGR